MNQALNDYFRIIEINRLELLKELFLLTKDSQDIMSFLNQTLPEEEGQLLLTSDEIEREQAFLAQHQVR